MIAAGVVGSLDGGLKVGDVQVVADNDLIVVVDAVEAEIGHDLSFPFQGIRPGGQLGGQIEQMLPHIVVGEFVGFNV